MPSIPQLLVGPNESASLISNDSTFDVGRINFQGDDDQIALNVSGHTIIQRNLDVEGNVFLGVTSGNSLGVSNVPPSISQSQNLIVGTTSYFMRGTQFNDIIVRDAVFLGNGPGLTNSFRITNSDSGSLKIHRWNTTNGSYELSLILDHQVCESIP